MKHTLLVLFILVIVMSSSLRGQDSLPVRRNRIRSGKAKRIEGGRSSRSTARRCGHAGKSPSKKASPSQHAQ